MLMPGATKGIPKELRTTFGVQGIEYPIVMKKPSKIGDQCGVTWARRCL